MRGDGSVQAKKGSLYYVMRLPDENGKLHQKWNPLKLKEGAPKREINAAVQRIKEQYASDSLVYSKNVDFVQWIERWLHFRQSELAENTMQSYQSYLEKWIRPYFTERRTKLQKITARDIQNYYQHLTDHNLKPTSLKKHRAVINGSLQWAFQQGLIVENPAKRTRLPRDTNPFQGDFYTPEEVKALFDALKDTELYTAVFLAVCLGLRRSELLGLEWSAIDMKSRVVHIVKTVVCQKNVLVKKTTKSASSRRDLPMSDEVYQFLKNLQHEQKLQRLQFGPDYIVNDVVCKHKNGAEYKPTDISHQFKKALEVHWLRHIRFHDLRHTCASLMLLNHVPIKAVQVFMGHSSASTTMDIYAHVDLTQKAAAADTLCDVLKDALSV